MNAIPRLRSVLFACLIVLGSCGLVSCGAMTDPRPAEKVTDAQIRDNLIQALNAEFAAEKGVNIHPHVRSKIVLLTGNVEQHEQKMRATEILASVADIDRLYNELVVGPPSGIGSRVGDTILQNRVRLAFLNHKEVPNNKIEVVVRDSVVYLLGRATPDEKEQALAVLVQLSGIERIATYLATAIRN